jgi:hypothetical protein
MGVKKLQNLFKPKGPKKQNLSAVRTPTTPSPKKDEGDKSQTIKDKAEIEAYIKSINSKLKDKDMAKKAAQILETWVNSKK